MPVLVGLHTDEMRRILHCQGCKYLGRVSSNGYCKYYLETDIRRPNPFGIENCSVKELDASKAEVEEIVKKTLARSKNCFSTNVAKWDVKTAKKLFDDGYQFSKIAEYIGVPRRYVVQYAHKHGWTKEAD